MKFGIIDNNIISIKKVYTFMALSNAHPSTTTPHKTWRTHMQTAAVLFKLRVVSLLLMASVGGAFLAADGWPGFGSLFLVLLTGGMSAAGASCLNQYIERDKDKKMTRTSKRPLPTGAIDQQWVPFAGINLIVLACIIAAPIEIMLAVWLFIGAFIYVVIYTIWLKPRTLLNIVIGGAAGSAAVMSGGAAVGNAQHQGVIVLALLLFLWTPSHFWSLAMLYRDDYMKADVPMLPTQMSMTHAAWWVLSHTIPTAIAALLLTLTPELGWFYFVPILFASIDMVRQNVRLIYHATPQNARTFFMSSNIYLTIVLVAICLDTLLF